MEFAGYEEKAVLNDNGEVSYYQLTMIWKETK
jgi:hypothetical protein